MPNANRAYFTARRTEDKLTISPRSADDLALLGEHAERIAETVRKSVLSVWAGKEGTYEVAFAPGCMALGRVRDNA